LGSAIVSNIVTSHPASPAEQTAGLLDVVVVV
jgi:hypothetical protein